MTSIRCIDTHTGGEPTRVVIAGGPDLGTGTIAERRERFARDADPLRRAILLEPRGSNVLVGALLCPSTTPEAEAGVIFFNNVGMLGMCGHGTIGVAVALAHLNRISPGTHRLETPVGDVRFNLLGPNEAAIENVPSYRLAKDIRIDTPDAGTFTGDIAYGGNCFFIAKTPLPLVPANIPHLTQAALALKAALLRNRITGPDGAEIDHIEFTGPSPNPDSLANARNFVLCPGGEYDRSPCGTGTSAKLACLAADNHLAPGDEWIQESIIGSTFTGSYTPLPENRIRPTIRGTAYVCGDNTLLLDPNDPFIFGIT